MSLFFEKLRPIKELVKHPCEHAFADRRGVVQQLFPLHNAIAGKELFYRNIAALVCIGRYFYQEFSAFFNAFRCAGKYRKDNYIGRICVVVKAATGSKSQNDVVGDKAKEWPS